MTEKNIYQTLTDKIMLTGSMIIPKLFQMIVDEEEAALLLAMPGTPEQLAQKTGRPADELESVCKSLYHRGVVFKSYKTGTVGYKMCRDMIQFHDATILWPEAPKAYHDLWQEFMETEWPDFARLAVQFFPTAFTRIIPVEESVDTGGQKILDVESANKIIETAEKLAVTKCTCRVIAHKCDNPLEVCIQVDNAARYTLDRGTGREVTRQEALDILRLCEDKGLVHVTMNRAEGGHFICNCCSCCCQALPLVIAEGLNLCAPSRYQAAIDPDLCASCGTCVERCQFNAIETPETTGVDAYNVLSDRCMGCGLCRLTCPEGAITMRETRPVDFIPA